MTRENPSDTYSTDSVTIVHGDVSTQYTEWEPPITIVSDGAYGTGTFPGEPSNPSELVDWYEPHVNAWSEHATAETTLWFWNTERGWAEVHPLLKANGWEYRGANIWNKGIEHIAGNSNTERLRKFPQVTEMCVQYVYRAEFDGPDGDKLDIQEWVIREWERAGLTRQEANEACGVVDAASRKYLTRGELWYFPPPERMTAMVEYANKHGDTAGKPYFAIDDEPITKSQWERMRAKFNCPAGVTNVWEHPQVKGSERVTTDGETEHMNQKPLALMRRIIEASTERGDVVWEPFGGLCSGAVAGKELNRVVHAAEQVEKYYSTAVNRVKRTSKGCAISDPDNTASQAKLEQFDD